MLRAGISPRRRLAVDLEREHRSGNGAGTELRSNGVRRGSRPSAPAHGAHGRVLPLHRGSLHGAVPCFETSVPACHCQTKWLDCKSQLMVRTARTPRDTLARFVTTNARKGHLQHEDLTDDRYARYKPYCGANLFPHQSPHLIRPHPPSFTSTIRTLLVSR